MSKTTPDFLESTHAMYKPIARLKIKSYADIIELTNFFKGISKSDMASILRKNCILKNVEIHHTTTHLDDEGDYLTLFMPNDYLINYCTDTGRAEILELIA